MSVIMPNACTAQIQYAKYDFPRVVITGTQICCGLRPCYLDNAKSRYNDQHSLPSPYQSMTQIIFGMCYFTEHRHLHQYANRQIPAGLDGNEWRYCDIMHRPNNMVISMYPGGGAPNFRWWVLDSSKASLFTHYAATIDQIASYITANALGECTITPSWRNPNTGVILKTLIWAWNGRVPTPESCGLSDFPFDAHGKPIPGRTNLRNYKGEPMFPESVVDLPATEVAA